MLRIICGHDGTLVTEYACDICNAGLEHAPKYSYRHYSTGHANHFCGEGCREQWLQELKEWIGSKQNQGIRLNVHS